MGSLDFLNQVPSVSQPMDNANGAPEKDGGEQRQRPGPGMKSGLRKTVTRIPRVTFNESAHVSVI